MVYSRAIRMAGLSTQIFRFESIVIHSVEFEGAVKRRQVGGREGVGGGDSGGKKVWGMKFPRH
jgi:hypothetical protein